LRRELRFRRKSAFWQISRLFTIVTVSILNAWGEEKVMAAAFPELILTKWNTVALWAVDIEQETCGICKYVCF
jgi:hypothetical protein